MEGRRSLTRPISPTEYPNRRRAPTVETIPEDEEGGVHDNPRDVEIVSGTIQGDSDPIQVTESANSSHSGPVLPNELEELRAWYKRTKEVEEIRALRRMKAQYEVGDNTMFSIPGMPEPPQIYSKKNRAEFNRWERDCESFFLGSPANFVSEAQKVEFGTRYVSEPLKTLWKFYCESQLRRTPQWMPTWAKVKLVMLDTLGTALERQQNAYESLRRCKQRPQQSPTDLLDYMRLLWEELGAERTPRVQVLEYTSALLPYIQKYFYLLPADRRDTLPLIEEQANVIFRRRGLFDQDSRPDKSRKQTRANASSEGDIKPPKKAKNQEKRQFVRGRHHKPNNGASPGARCYECGEAGHLRPYCPKTTQQAESYPNKEPEKEKGSKGKALLQPV